MTSPHLAPLADCGCQVFLCGQIAFDKDGAVTDDIAAQTRRCLERLETVRMPAAFPWHTSSNARYGCVISMISTRSTTHMQTISERTSRAQVVRMTI